jgi:hypothetical protein
MTCSATPIYNYGGEFYNVLECTTPGRLGSHEEFTREWCDSSGEKALIKNPKAFGSWLIEQGIMVRRTRRDVGRELPPVSIFRQVIDADLHALKHVEQSCAELARLILRQGEAFRGEKMMASREFDMRLRQATGIAKAPYVAAFVRMLVETGQKVVLYGWHREVYNIWLKQLADLNPVMYTGSESNAAKERSKQAFVSGKAGVFIISLRAGAGLDGLQHITNTVVMGELDWTYGVHEQDIGRVARDGQQNPTMVYFLVTEDGSDPVLEEVAGVKRMQLEGVRSPAADIVQQLTIDPAHVKRLAESYLSRMKKR